MGSKGTQPCIYMPSAVHPFSLKLPSHPACHITKSRIPCAMQWILVGHPFLKFSSVYMQLSLKLCGLNMKIESSLSIYIISLSSALHSICPTLWEIIFAYQDQRLNILITEAMNHVGIIGKIVTLWEAGFAGVRALNSSPGSPMHVWSTGNLLFPI